MYVSSNISDNIFRKIICLLATLVVGKSPFVHSVNKRWKQYEFTQSLIIADYLKWSALGNSHDVAVLFVGWGSSFLISV